MKVITVKESQNISIAKIDELVGSLPTFEMAIDDKSGKRKVKV